MIDKYHDKKILPIIVRLVDIIQNKKWVVNYDNETTDWIIQNKGVEMGKVKIQTKKAIINIPSNDLTINLHLGKDKENKQKAMVNQTFISSFVKKGSIPPINSKRPNYEDSLDIYS
jgi:hypothetical protein